MAHRNATLNPHTAARLGAGSAVMRDVTNFCGRTHTGERAACTGWGRHPPFSRGLGIYYSRYV